MNKQELTDILNDGWWIQVSPLAKIQPTEWIAGIYRKGKRTWVTENCKGGFESPFKAHEWGVTFIKNYKLKKQNT